MMQSTTSYFGVHATANRSKRYYVRFSKADGAVISVSSVFRRSGGHRDCEREIWHRRSGTEMSLTAKCAVNAALRDLAKKMKPDEQIGLAIIAGMEIEQCD